MPKLRIYTTEAYINNLLLVLYIYGYMMKTGCCTVYSLQWVLVVQQHECHWPMPALLYHVSVLFKFVGVAHFNFFPVLLLG